jgi:hypothetical protein
MALLNPWLFYSLKKVYLSLGVIGIYMINRLLIKI